MRCLRSAESRSLLTQLHHDSYLVSTDSTDVAIPLWTDHSVGRHIIPGLYSHALFNLYDLFVQHAGPLDVEIEETGAGLITDLKEVFETLGD